MKILFEVPSPTLDQPHGDQYERVWDLVPRVGEYVTLYMGEDQPTVSGGVTRVRWMQAPSGGVYVVVKLHG